MGWNDHEDLGLSEEMEAALEYLEEGTAAYGIAQQVAEKGPSGLSEKQRYVYESVVLPAVSKASAAAEEAEFQRKLHADNT